MSRTRLPFHREREGSRSARAGAPVVSTLIALVARLVPAVTLLVAAGALSIGTWGCGDSTGPRRLQPGLSALEPDSGTVGTEVEILGADFESGIGVSFGPIEATSVTVVSPSALLVHAPDSLQASTVYDVTVTNPGGKSAVLPGAYRTVPPHLVAVNGVSRPSGLRGSTIIFEGHAFGDLLGKGAVWFTRDGGQPVAAEVISEDNWTNEFIVTTVPQSAVSGPAWIETRTGTSRPLQFTLSEAASFSPSQIFWTETVSLPEPSQGHKAVFLSGEDVVTDNIIFVTGGADGGLIPRAAVWSASIDLAGGILPWSTLGPLPAARAFHGLALATPYNALMDTTLAGHLYVLGGLDSGGAATTTVYRAPVYTDRMVGAWVEEAMLPVPLHSMGAAIFRSWLFVAGGAGSGHGAMASVYRARIQGDGSLGPWESQPSLPDPRAYASLIQFADALYMVGGEGGTAAPGSASTTPTQSGIIFVSTLDLRTAQIEGGWATNPSTLIKAAAKHTTLVAGGTVLVSGGVYNGAGNSATEHQYAQINLDGTIGSFNGATGSQTIEAIGGVPFFNHAAITYVDGAGAAHVVILGGNNINDPTTPTGRNYYY